MVVDHAVGDEGDLPPDQIQQLLPAEEPCLPVACHSSLLGGRFGRGQKILHHPQLALGPLIDAERKAAAVRVKREGLHFWNREAQLQRRAALRRNPPDFTARGEECPGYNVTVVPRPPQPVILRQTAKQLPRLPSVERHGLYSAVHLEHHFPAVRREVVDYSRNFDHFRLLTGV